MSDTFHKLAPFIQEYIYNHGWTELRPVQIEACKVIFDTDAHLLITAGTAAGKTEAAFLPILTLLNAQPSTTIGAMYIGPIKALINDQFQRLNDLVKEADIPVWHWHGDVSQSRKNKLLKNPQGILQITPESLESLLINKSGELSRLFGNLRFVVIDEVHAFMGSERGCQIQCQLTRLEKFVKEPFRRIGLSATLGDYGLAEGWLSAGTNRRVITPQIEGVRRNIRLAVECFETNRTEAQDAEIREKDGVGAKHLETKYRALPIKYSPHASPFFNPSDYERYVFNLCRGRRCLIFANSRGQTESIISALRQVAVDEGLPDVYHVHHGSISARLREAAEKAMRDGDVPAVTAATLTLELGIDIGQLERVIQLDAPLSVASFLQRLGRSGRRGEAADMRFVCVREIGDEASFPEQFPWQLLQCIAIIQLYLEEKWIEPILPVKYPLSLLYHQTMSVLVAQGEVSPAALAKQVLSLPPCRKFSQTDYKQLLLYLIALDHIQKTETGRLIIGLAGERVIGKFQFYAVFPDNEEFVVKDATMEVGSIVSPPGVGSQFALAGRSWEVVEIDFKKRAVFVKQVEGKASISWRGGKGNIHSRVLERMRQVLVEDAEYSYLQKNALRRLREVRKLAREYGLDKQNIISLGQDSCCIFPWMGSVAFRTLERLLNFYCREALEIKSIGGVNPYFLTVKLGKSHLENLQMAITNLCEARITAEDLVGTAEAPQLQKYDEFMPQSLLRKAFAVDYLDLDELRERVKRWEV